MTTDYEGNPCSLGTPGTIDLHYFYLVLLYLKSLTSHKTGYLLFFPHSVTLSFFRAPPDNTGDKVPCMHQSFVTDKVVITVAKNIL